MKQAFPIFLFVIYVVSVAVYITYNALTPRVTDILHVENTIQPTVYTVTGISNVHDGDTFTGTIQLPLGISYTGRIRCKGYDAFELSEPKGKPAQEYLDKLTKVSKFFVGISYKDKQMDSFGRVLGDVMYEDKDGNMIMLSEDMRKQGFVNEESPWSHAKTKEN